MAKAQRNQFTSIEEMLASLPPLEREMTDMLRNLVYDCVPKVKEKLAFNVSSFHHYSGLCLVWPGSVDWMGKSTPGRVEIAFMKGHLLRDRYGYLEKGSRTMVFNKHFFHPDQINTEILAELIYEAADLNLELWQAKKVRMG